VTRPAFLSSPPPSCPSCPILSASRGQRAAIEFGIDIDSPGFKHLHPRSQRLGARDDYPALLEQKAAAGPVPSDWVYVETLLTRTSHAPSLAAGQGAQLRADMQALVSRLQTDMPRGLRRRIRRGPHPDRARARRGARRRVFQAEPARRERGFALGQTPAGLILAPVVQGQPPIPMPSRSFLPSSSNSSKPSVSSWKMRLQTRCASSANGKRRPKPGCWSSTGRWPGSRRGICWTTW